MSKYAVKGAKVRLHQLRLNHLRYVLIPCCLLGFLYQIRQYLLLYWTYPVVVDIQVTSPYEITLPAISFCNINGIKPPVFCKLGAKCYPPFLFYFLNPCLIFPIMCQAMNDSMAKDFLAVAYHKIMHDRDFNAAMLAEVKKPMEDFFKCKIVSSNEERPCNTDDALIGSYYSESDMFSSCYTINSLWSQPENALQKIKVTEKLFIEFYIDISDRPVTDLDQPLKPKHNYPLKTSTVQFLLHNNFASMSPFTTGVEFLGGRKYQIKLKQEEKHLLPAPYQTNCTDYLLAWRARGGKGPLNEMMVIEECKYNLSMKLLGCVPFTVDYPHNDTVCRECTGCPERIHIEEQCAKLVEQYNQPCDLISYEMRVKDKPVFLEKKLANHEKNFSESIILKQRSYDCIHGKAFTRRCQFIDLEVLFDDFEITTTTFKPKMESEELVSVIGGYMGIYLGIAMVSVYDIIQMIAVAIQRSVKKPLKNKIRKPRRKHPRRHQKNRISRSSLRSIKVSPMAVKN